MCEKCPIDQRYPYYGFPVTPDSRKLRDEAERYREIAIRCFVAESDCADVKRADALWREMCRAGDEARFLCSNARRLEIWKKPYSVGLSNIPIVLTASVCADSFQAFGREPCRVMTSQVSADTGTPVSNEEQLGRLRVERRRLRTRGDSRGV